MKNDAWGEAIDLFGGAISLSFKEKSFSLTLGTSYSAGSGKARLGSFGFGDQRNPGELVDAQKSQWITFLSASF